MSAIIDFIEQNPRIIIGNAFGFIAVIFAFLSYQAATPKKLLFLHSALIVAVIISYAILGAWSGMVLNIVCLLRNFTYATDKVPLFKKKYWPWILAIVIGGLGVLSWQGPISLLVIIPLMINTVFMSLNDNNKLRASILFTSTAVATYDWLSTAYLAFLMETITIISAIIGLIRYRKELKK